MIGILTSKTRRLYLRPPSLPYCLNRDSAQARGLVLWCPFGEVNPRNYMDFAGGRSIVQGGTMTLARGPDESGFCPSNTGSTSNWLHFTAYALVTAVPLSMSCWFNPVNVTNDMNLMNIGNGAADNFFNLFIDGGSAVAVNATTVGTGGTGKAVSTTDYVANSWQHACGVWTSTALRAVYRNGGSKGTETTTVTPSGVDRNSFGAYRGTSTTFNPINGRFADVRIHNVALTDEEVWMQYDPATRWELYYPIGIKSFSFHTEAAGGGDVAAVYKSLMLTGVGN